MATYTILNSMSEDICKKIKRIVKKCEKNHIEYMFNVSEPYTKLVKVNDKSFEVCLVNLNLDVICKSIPSCTLSRYVEREPCFSKRQKSQTDCSSIVNEYGMT